MSACSMHGSRMVMEQGTCQAMTSHMVDCCSTTHTASAYMCTAPCFLPDRAIKHKSSASTQGRAHNQQGQPPEASARAASACRDLLPRGGRSSWGTMLPNDCGLTPRMTLKPSTAWWCCLSGPGSPAKREGMMLSTAEPAPPLNSTLKAAPAACTIHQSWL